MCLGLFKKYHAAQEAYDYQEEPTRETCEDGMHLGPWDNVGSYTDKRGNEIEFVRCRACGGFEN